MFASQRVFLGSELFGLLHDKKRRKNPATHVAEEVVSDPLSVMCRARLFRSPTR
jgi:hypothetical protein